MINKRNKEHLHHTLVMVYIRTFLVYLIGIHLNRYHFFTYS